MLYQLECYHIKVVLQVCTTFTQILKGHRKYITLSWSTFKVPMVHSGSDLPLLLKLACNFAWSYTQTRHAIVFEDIKEVP